MDTSNLIPNAEEQPVSRPQAEAQQRRAWVTPRVERISTGDTQTSSNSYYRLDGASNYS